MLCLDISKAFDSVCHRAIYNILENRGLDYGFIQYISFIYENSKTMLSFKGRVSEKRHPSRGVRQGDPLSPLVFLLVMDEILFSIPEHLVFCGKDDIKVNVIAYADDLGLFSNSPCFLQKMLNIVCENSPLLRLELNTEKYFSFSWVTTNKRLKTFAFNEKHVFNIFNNLFYISIRPLRVKESFKYFGA